MHIVIVEDEPLVLQRIARFTTELLSDVPHKIVTFTTLAEAEEHLSSQEIDLLFLDLNLQGENGFDLLKNQLAQGFHTVIISAYAEKAIEAFEYGVLDFIAKPFTKARIQKALDKIQNNQLRTHYGCRYLSVKKVGMISLVPVSDINYIKADGHYSQLALSTQSESVLHSKNIQAIETLLPKQFERIHRSYIANMNMADKLIVESGSRYHLVLKNGEQLPVSRNKFDLLREKLNA